jgi:PKD repeat protein
MKRLTALSTLFLSAAFRVSAQNAAATINVDASANRHPISPYVYGVAYGDASTLPDLNCPINRYGGNNTSRYNWQVNGDNRGADWYFESIGETSSTPGERGDTIFSTNKAAGSQTMLTVPTIGWVAKLGANRSKLASFSIAKYGAQTGSDAQWFPDAGNGVLKSNGQNITGNDPNDADVISDSVFQQGWIQHLVSKWGTAASGGVGFYILDNEPSIWFSTHRDVAPIGATMDDVRNRILDYAAAIKASDPSALVVGPEEWGWSGYFYSGYDQQYGSLHGWSNLPDRAAHGNWDYLPWLLDQLRQNEIATGKRLLDVFSVHYYPQGGEFSNDVTTATQTLRNKSTRSLWDPSYVDTSWINDKVELIPRMKSWVATYDPGLKTAITEYNWGAESDMNGATAQADIFGIFGREGLDYAARWTTPASSTPTYKAMKMYRNYDGNKSTFGDTSIAAGGPNPDNVASFAAVRSSDGALTVMVVNKYLSGNTPVTVNLANFAAGGPAQAWQLAASNAIVRLSDVALSGSAFSATLPPKSVTLFVVPGGGVANAPPVAAASATPSSGIAPLAVAFDGSASHDSDGTVVSYGWAFGDGGTGSGANVGHTYSAAGNYTATLTVTDDRGATGKATVSISATTDPNVIAAPANLTASVSRAGAVTLKWADNSSNETGFYVERAPSGSTSYVRVATVGANVTTFTQSPGSGRYVYRVQAFNATTGRTSPYSNSVNVRVK